MTTPPAPASEPQGTATGPQGTEAADDAASQQLAELVESQEGGGSKEPGPDTIDYWKAQARKHETRAKQQAAQLKPLTAKAKAFDDLTEQQKTEQQRLQDRAERAEQAEREAVASRHRLLAAAAHDLHPELADFLGTGTEDEITARAETLARVISERAAEIAAAGQPPQNGRPQRPVESLRPGAAPAGDGRPPNSNDLFRQMVRRGR
jgi:hypothetical protein